MTARHRYFAVCSLFVLILLVSIFTSLAADKRTCRVCGAALLSHAESDFDGDSLDSKAKTFHHYGIHSHAEVYLVCVYEVEETGKAKNEMKIKATVVDAIKGARKAGKKLVFTRVSDASREEVARQRLEMLGALYYVFVDLQENGRLEVDAQDPMALQRYTEELQEIVERHKSKCLLKTNRAAATNRR